MNLDEALDCARPLFWRSSDPEHPVWGRGAGTCFLLALDGETYLVTARHNVRGDVADLLVPVNIDEPRLDHVFAFDEVIKPSVFGAGAADVEDTAQLDLLVLHVVAPPLGLRVVDLDVMAPARFKTARTTDLVRFCGFPISLDNAIDYEAKSISLARFHCDGRYAGRDTSKRLHIVEVETFGKVTDLSGMSGGPAFYVRPDAGEYDFAGVIVRGGVEARLVRFIDWTAIVALLKGFATEIE